jgi:hypothetical protein
VKGRVGIFMRERPKLVLSSFRGDAKASNYGAQLRT